MKVLIAYDGSDCAKAAVQDLCRAGLPADAEAFVVSVAEHVVNVGALGAENLAGFATTSSVLVREAVALSREAVAAARQTAAEGAALVTAHFPRWRVECGAEADTAYAACAAILRKAEEWHADLIVVGSHGRSPLGRLILGSVSQKVLTHATCSVRVGRCGDTGATTIPTADEPPRLLLALDSSPGSAAAAEAVRSRRWPAGTEVRVVTAVDLKLLSSIATHGLDLDYEPNADANLMLRRGLEKVSAVLRREGLTAEPVLLDGDANRAVVQEAERWGADCIFLGAHGRGRIARFLLGSVSAAVAARAHCSVEVVRQG